MVKEKGKQLLSRYEAVNRKRRLTIVAVTFFVVLGGYWYFLFQPHWMQMRAHEKKIQELDSQIALYRSKIARLPEVEQQLAKRQREWTYAKALLPNTSQEVEELLASIERVGKDVGIEFLLFAPGKENEEQYYVSRHVDLRLQGDFHSLMLFFSRLSQFDRLVRLENLRLRPQQDTGEAVELTADSDISMYRALTEAEIAAREEDNEGDD